MADKNSVHIVVDLSDRCAHLYNISMHFSKIGPARFSMPAWTPGSYMIREFAQHIVSLKAAAQAKELLVKKLNKNTFEVEANGPCTLQYQVYAFDSSIRAAFIDGTQAFFNGTALFLRPHDETKFTLEIAAPSDWQVATGLECAGSFGPYLAKNYDELSDHPFQISPMKRLHFTALGIPHEIALVSDVRAFDEARLVSDLTKLCEHTLKMFDDPPFSKYLFIARFEEGGYGGLEHRNSSMLLSSPQSLPKIGTAEPDSNYRNFLSLCAHEYFHAWNVKKLKPKNFHNYDYDNECYTSMLWIFEGITAYYDDLLIKRANLISAQSYLEMMAKNYSRLLKTPGRFVQSVADASQDAWIKFYRPNENSQNHQVSYYLKGSFIALMLDLMIRLKTEHKKSLDDVMRRALKNFPAGIDEAEFLMLIKEIGGLDIEEVKKDYIYGTKELPLESILRPFGINASIGPDELWIDDKNKLLAFFGFRLRFENLSALISFVEKDSPAMLAGLNPHDEIIAINDIRFDAVNAYEVLGSLRAKEQVDILFSRKKRLLKTKLMTKELPNSLCRFISCAETEDQKSNLKSWLG